MTLRLGVVLPTFNERKNLRGMVERLDKALAGIPWEVIIVDDNSPDGTSDEARAIFAASAVMPMEKITCFSASEGSRSNTACPASAPIAAPIGPPPRKNPAAAPPTLPQIDMAPV